MITKVSLRFTKKISWEDKSHYYKISGHKVGGVKWPDSRRVSAAYWLLMTTLKSYNCEYILDI